MTDLELARKCASEAFTPIDSAVAASLAGGFMDDVTEVQSALLAIKAEREAVVKWLMDPERCPFGKAPHFYAAAIEKGEHHG